MKHFLAAIRFITIFPAGQSRAYDPIGMIPFFPLVGLLLGGITAILDRLLIHIWNPSVVSLMDVLLLVLMTGAFHLDGLADTADGLLSHRNQETALRIMKDSRIGVMGVVAILFALALKWAGISALGDDRGLCLLIVPAYARAGMIFGIRFLRYGRASEGLGRAFFEKPVKPVAFAGLLLPAGLSLFLGAGAIGLNLVYAVFVLIILHYYRKKMDCVTGDMLGAMTEALESVLFLSISIGG